MTFTPNMPVGNYWTRQDWKKLDGSIAQGSLEIIYISGETTHRRKPCRLVIGKHWQETLDKMIASDSIWKLEGPINPPNWD